MNEDALAILAGIRERPDDDLARLVFADWLDEHTVADWAEAIRTQIEATRERDKVRFSTLSARADELIGRHPAWDTVFAGGLPTGSFARGLPYRLTVHGEPTRQARHVLARYPVQELILVSPRADFIDGVSHRRWLHDMIEELRGGPVRELCLSGYALDAGDLEAVAGLDGLERLTVWGRHTSVGAWQALRRLTRLRHLALVGGPRGVDYTAVASLPSLTGLEVCGIPLSAPSLRRLLTAPSLRTVRCDGFRELPMADDLADGIEGSNLALECKLDLLSRGGHFDRVLRLARQR